jgi:hypothetical protein
MLSCKCFEAERASYNGSIEASQASDVGSIPIARSINLRFLYRITKNDPDQAIACGIAFFHLPCAFNISSTTSRAAPFPPPTLVT